MHIDRQPEHEARTGRRPTVEVVPGEVLDEPHAARRAAGRPHEVVEVRTRWPESLVDYLVTTYRSVDPPPAVRFSFAVLTIVLSAGPLVQLLITLTGTKMIDGIALPESLSGSILLYATLGMVCSWLIGELVLLEMRAGRRWARNLGVGLAGVAAALTCLGLSRTALQVAAGGGLPAASRMFVGVVQLLALLLTLWLMLRPSSRHYYARMQ